MRLNFGFLKINTECRYLIKALGWTNKEAQDLEIELNSEKKFVVVTKDVQMIER